MLQRDLYGFHRWPSFVPFSMMMAKMGDLPIHPIKWWEFVTVALVNSYWIIKLQNPRPFLPDMKRVGWGEYS